MTYFICYLKIQPQFNGFVRKLQFEKRKTFDSNIYDGTIYANTFIIDVGSFLNTLNQRKTDTAQKIKFSIKDFFSKCDQIRWKLRIWSHLLKKSLIENFIFCAVKHYRQSQFLLGNSQIAMNLNETPIKFWKHVKK